MKSSDFSCQQQGFAWCCLLLSLLHILHRSMTMLNVEVAVSCCSGLIEMVHNVSLRSLRRDFSHSSFLFYSLIPAVLMPHAESSESLGEINSWQHILWKLWYHTGRVEISWVYSMHSFYNLLKHKCACKHATATQVHTHTQQNVQPFMV